MVGVDEDLEWNTAQTDDVQMREPGSMTGKRTRNNQSPPEEGGGREILTRSIKQELIEESVDKEGKKADQEKNVEMIDLTNTDDEVESSEKNGADSEKEETDEEDSDELYDNENSDSNEETNETSSKEETDEEMKSDNQESENENSEDSGSDTDIQFVSVHSPSKKSRHTIQDSSEDEVEEDTENDSEEGYEIPDFNMEHSLEKKMMAKFHEIKADKLMKLSNFWYVKKAKGGYNPTALKYPTKDYGDRFKKKLVAQRRKENNAITLALGGSPTLRGRSRIKKKVTPLKEDRQAKTIQKQPSTNIKKTRKSTSPTTHSQDTGKSTTHTIQTNTTKNIKTKEKTNKNKTVTIVEETIEKEAEENKTQKTVTQKLPKTNWAAKASAEYKRTTMKHTWRLDITFDVTTKIANSNDGERMATALRQTLEECMKQGQRIDSTFGILPWKTAKPLPTLFTKQKIPKMTYDELLSYLRPPMQGMSLQQVKQGRNFKWKINTTFNGETELFADRWGRAVLNTFYVSDYPTQSEQTFCAGMCMGSTEKQVLGKINTELEEITGIEGIRASIQNIYHRGVTTALWKEARSMATKADGKIDNTLKHMYAPSGIQIFVPERTMVKKAQNILYQKYGRNVEDEFGNKDAYPTWPGGAQMKFVPHAENNMSSKNREKIGERIKMHTIMKRNLVSYDLDITDPDMELECLEGKTIGEAILQIMTTDKKNPVFRHFQHKWHPDPMVQEYKIVAHKVFKKEADSCMETLKNVLVEKYGDGVLKAFVSRFRGLNNPFPIYGEETEDEIELEDDSVDKFLNKTITCQMDNMEIVETSKEKETTEETPYVDDDSQLTNLDKTVAHTNASDISPGSKSEFSSLTDTYMKKMQQKSNSFPLWKLKSMDEMLQIDGVQKLIKARGVEESVVRAVLNIIKLNPEVAKSPDIPITDQGTETTVEQTSESTDNPGTAAADEARKTK